VLILEFDEHCICNKPTVFYLKKTEDKTEIQVLFVCWKVVFFWKVNSEKVNYFLMFGSVMKNKLENTFKCLVMSWKMSWKITY